MHGNGFMLALLLCTTVPAATLQQLTMDQMTQSATAIVRARVVSASASFTGSTIYTHYKLQIVESWKGFPTAEVMLPGGVANGLRQSFPGIPQLEPGGEYVMFLWTSSSTGITHLVGLTQGLFHVNSQADGSTVASRAPIGEMMLDGSGHRVADQAISMKLTDMKGRVSQTLRQGAH
jgi:hypothetical protein